MTDASIQALSVLRSTENLQWYIVPFITLILYIYNMEMEKKRFDRVLMGIYFFATSGVCLEIVNALVLHFTGFSALWTTPGRSAYVIYVGWNAEIFFLAALGGISALTGLPEKDAKIVHLNNRLVLPVLWAVAAVAVEVLLNRAGILVWEYRHWRWPNVYFMILWWAAPYYLLLWLYDNLSLRGKGILAASGVAAAVCAHLLFAVVLKWV
ncbi:MAG: hypothetical protein JXA20_17365 [Spirochaetes bacterium]|nr:hypothetical protein [Spirochaetota bacterium]